MFEKASHPQLGQFKNSYIAGLEETQYRRKTVHISINRFTKIDMMSYIIILMSFQTIYYANSYFMPVYINIGKVKISKNATKKICTGASIYSADS